VIENIGYYDNKALPLETDDDEPEQRGCSEIVLST
jgi:hypothetical protein